MDRFFTVGQLGTNSATYYAFQAPFRCTVRNVLAQAQNSDIGDADTVTILKASTTVGVATFGSGIAAFAKATYVGDSTGKNIVFEAGDNILINVSALDAAGDRVNVVLDLDHLALGI